MAEQGPGSKIGRYQLVAPIGAGGMGKVWVALDAGAPTLRLVALKTTLGNAESSANPEYWAALADEASVASRIHHPNVCMTHEFGQDGTVHFLVMDWSDGASLRDLLGALPDRRISPELAAYIAAGVAAGLHAAHELNDEHGQSLGVVHRDVSPQNILVSMRGHVRLADFGVAKSRGQLHRPTETGEVKGKLSYMAPEQVTSRNIDRRADIFALGCVLYEAVLGTRPFHGADALATMYKILEEDLLPPRAIEPNFPEELERVLLKALAKDPAARYQTADELREGLLDYLASSGSVVVDKHVAELLKQGLGSQLQERNRAIMMSAEQLKKGETDPRRLHTPSPPAATQTLTPEGGVERNVTAAQPAPPGPGRSGRALVASVAVGAALLVGVWFTYGAKQAPASPPAATTRTQAAVPAVTPLPAPPAVTSEVPASVSSSPATAPPTATPAVPPGARRPARVSAPPTPSASAAPVASATTSSPFGKLPTRKPRPIDRDNPFAIP